ncbi:hypothetical protein HAP47_0034425 [Bradyrhizobium sp. 41S5]|uniref:hypothetical protein n=1 Tax=Bradyrhizobium sp. 41S5 TaxID=1404443 RepID=UPI00156B5605|nr:hypothetical protein [Bradyrhizobium sp. 41S5]UFX44196.1 hypothetical protein HAP47_0034425 [Bradyrhizobium sp. 41S5]
MNSAFLDADLDQCEFGDTITLEQVCLVSGARPTRVFDLVRAIEVECANFSGRLKKTATRIHFQHCAFDGIGANHSTKLPCLH